MKLEFGSLMHIPPILSPDEKFLVILSAKTKKKKTDIQSISMDIRGLLRTM